MFLFNVLLLHVLNVLGMQIRSCLLLLCKLAMYNMPHDPSINMWLICLLISHVVGSTWLIRRPHLYYCCTYTQRSRHHMWSKHHRHNTCKARRTGVSHFIQHAWGIGYCGLGDQQGDAHHIYCQGVG